MKFASGGAHQEVVQLDRPRIYHRCSAGNPRLCQHLHSVVKSNVINIRRDLGNNTLHEIYSIKHVLYCITCSTLVRMNIVVFKSVAVLDLRGDRLHIKRPKLFKNFTA